ncbi:hypothetical protein [Achromobacter kerstersii]
MLQGVRSARGKALRSKTESLLLKGVVIITVLAYSQMAMVIVLAKGQQYGVVPYDHWSIAILLKSTLISLVAALIAMLIVVGLGLLYFRKMASSALLKEAEIDYTRANYLLGKFEKTDLVTARIFLDSKAAEIDSRTSMFYGAGAVYLLALANAAWTVAKDVLGESKLRELSAPHVAGSAPALLMLILGLVLVISLFRPLRSSYRYQVRLVDIALAEKDRPEPIKPIRPTSCWVCRFKWGLFGANK